MGQIRQHNTTLIFHNTRAQAEIFFHNLWLENTEALPIGIHHGSLDRQQRERVEAAMQRGELRAIICTGSLDLGIDWGDVDLVIQVGAPKMSNDWFNVSAAPTTAITRRQRHCWFPPTGSRSWNVVPRLRQSGRMIWMAIRAAPAPAMCCANTS